MSLVMSDRIREWLARKLTNSNPFNWTLADIQLRTASTVVRSVNVESFGTSYCRRINDQYLECYETIISDSFAYPSTTTITYDTVAVRINDYGLGQTIDGFRITYSSPKSFTFQPNTYYSIVVNLAIRNNPIAPGIWAEFLDPILEKLRGRDYNLEITRGRVDYVIDGESKSSGATVSKTFSEDVKKAYLTLYWDNNTGKDVELYNAVFDSPYFTPIIILYFRPPLKIPNGKRFRVLFSI